MNSREICHAEFCSFYAKCDCCNNHYHEIGPNHQSGFASVSGPKNITQRHDVLRNHDDHHDCALAWQWLYRRQSLRYRAVRGLQLDFRRGGGTLAQLCSSAPTGAKTQIGSNVSHHKTFGKQFPGVFRIAGPRGPRLRLSDIT